MIFLIGFLVALIVVAFLFMFSTTPQSGASALSEITEPDNSIGKAVPRLYGKAMMVGNCLYYSTPRATKIEECQ